MVNAGCLSKEKYLLGKTKRDKFRPGFELTIYSGLTQASIRGITTMNSVSFRQKTRQVRFAVCLIRLARILKRPYLKFLQFLSRQMSFTTFSLQMPLRLHKTTPTTQWFFQILVFYARLSHSAGPRGLLICFRVLLSCPNFAMLCCPFYLARFRCCLVHLSFSLFYVFLYHFWSLGLACFLQCQYSHFQTSLAHVLLPLTSPLMFQSHLLQFCFSFVARRLACHLFLSHGSYLNYASHMGCF